MTFIPVGKNRYNVNIVVDKGTVVEVSKPKYPVLETPMGVVIAAGATTCREFGRACDNGVTLSTTLICAPFTADHDARAADVPVVTVNQE